MHHNPLLGPTALGPTARGPTALREALDLQVAALRAVGYLLTRAHYLTSLAAEKQFWSGRSHLAYLESVQSAAREIAEASHRVDDAIALTRQAALALDLADSLSNGAIVGGDGVG